MFLGFPALGGKKVIDKPLRIFVEVCGNPKVQ